MSKDVKTVPGRFYTVTLKSAGTVKAKFAGGSLLLLASVSSAGQVFVQALSDLCEVSDDSAEVTSVKAPITVGGTGVTAAVFAEHEAQVANMSSLGHVMTGSVGVTLENGRLRLKFREMHSGFESDNNNAVFVNTGTDEHPTHGSIAPVGTDTAGKLCVPDLTSTRLAGLDELLGSKEALLALLATDRLAGLDELLENKDALLALLAASDDDATETVEAQETDNAAETGESEE